MTIRIAIENREPSNTPVGSHQVVFVGPPGAMESTVILPGESKEFHIHANAALVIASANNTPAMPDAPLPLKRQCDDLRHELKGIEKALRALMKHRDVPLDGVITGQFAEKFHGQAAEMKAQIMLAVRHVEDARMRIGKALQYADDGVSILDKPWGAEKPR